VSIPKPIATKYLFLMDLTAIYSRDRSTVFNRGAQSTPILVRAVNDKFIRQHLLGLVTKHQRIRASIRLNKDRVSKIDALKYKPNTRTYI
jgi:hypothetical protein